MKWQRGYESSNVEDRRGAGRRPHARRPPRPRRHRHPAHPERRLQAGLPLPGRRPRRATPRRRTPAARPCRRPPKTRPSSSCRSCWTTPSRPGRRSSREQRQQYTDARLILFRDGVQSACGFAESATGPFYCPGDSQVYIDLGFYDELRERFGAPGDFAEAYVLAHEIGHHVQRLLGTEAKVRRAQQRNPGAAPTSTPWRSSCRRTATPASGRTRRRRAGCWRSGDVEEGLAAAAAVGDDRIQRMGGGYVNPDAFTHGSVGRSRPTLVRAGIPIRAIRRQCDTMN